MKRLPLFATLALAAAVSAADDPARDVVAFNASVRVDVDAAGKPVKVEASADLPQAIRDYIEQRVAAWQYQPAKIDGVPQSATTYVAVKACAVPEAGSYRLGVDFAGNGPRTAADKRITLPMYPPEAQRRGTEAEFSLILRIQPDGHATLDKIERADISARAGASDFAPLLRQWVKTLHFDPEIVAGKPVAAQVRLPVMFTLDGRRTLHEEWQARAQASRECQIASGRDDERPTALEPAVTVIPQPAG